MITNRSHDPLIIAEANVSHKGSEQMALGLVPVAKRMDAGIVKFQHLVRAQSLPTATRTAAYQESNTGASAILGGVDFLFPVPARDPLA